MGNSRGDETKSAVEAPQATSDSDVVIAVRNVGKMYRLYDRPQDRLKEQLLWRIGKHYGREFWALRDVSFEVRRGERLGIIGRNGAGKSTLLQILAGILLPTIGEVQVRGRVAALLELGSGFNPEFTGRENVYMNGAVLGLSPEDLDARYEAIAAFADIGDFINQPVKLYSSGMLVRLAFAVSTHVDADVLFIDEALAVGDIFFRQKCYKRLDDLRERGVSVVLVSHAMTEVEQFCQQAILLNHGTVLFQGGAPEAVKRYYLVEQQEQLLSIGRASVALTSEVAAPPMIHSDEFWPSAEAFLDISKVTQVSNGWARCTAVALCNKEGNPSQVFEQGEFSTFFYEFEILHDIEVPIGNVTITNDKGVIVHGKSSMEYGTDVPNAVPSGRRLRFRQDISLEVAVGEYTFLVGLATINLEDYQRRGTYSHPDLHTRIARLCHLPAVGQIDLIFRRGGTPIQLLHHGIANLPGSCQVFFGPSTSVEDLAAGNEGLAVPSAWQENSL
jgi:ABC-type polysaccharide/polyol phosphate transport system ATPase subunit